MASALKHTSSWAGRSSPYQLKLQIAWAVVLMAQQVQPARDPVLSLCPRWAWNSSANFHWSQQLYWLSQSSEFPADPSSTSFLPNHQFWTNPHLVSVRIQSLYLPTAPQMDCFPRRSVPWSRTVSHWFWALDTSEPDCSNWVCFWLEIIASIYLWMNKV